LGFFKTAIAMDVEVGGVNPILEFLKLFWKNEKLKKCQVCFFKTLILTKKRNRKHYEF
jgi:hypothetical protein